MYLRRIAYTGLVLFTAACGGGKEAGNSVELIYGVGDVSTGLELQSDLYVYSANNVTGEPQTIVFNVNNQLVSVSVSDVNEISSRVNLLGSRITSPDVTVTMNGKQCQNTGALSGASLGAGHTKVTCYQ